MQVNEIHPQLSEEERDKRIGYITDEMLKIVARVKQKQLEKVEGN